MAVKLTCTDNASGHDGLRWRMGEDAQSVTTVVGETAPGVGELVVNSPIEPEACFSVAAYSGSDESEAASVCADTTEPVDFSTAAIGDEIGGGIYAGIDTIGGTDYHIVAGKADSEHPDMAVKTSDTATPGTRSNTDGLANTLAMESAGIADHPAAAHCLAYRGGSYADWHLPAISQVALLAALIDHPEFSDNASDTRFTWSSTEAANDTRNKLFRLSDQLEATAPKSFAYRRVRPFRRVAV